MYDGLGFQYGRGLLPMVPVEQTFVAFQAPEFTSAQYDFSHVSSRARHHTMVLSYYLTDKRVRLVGYSFGGLLASSMSHLLIPSNPTSLLLVDPMPYNSK